MVYSKSFPVLCLRVGRVCRGCISAVSGICASVLPACERVFSSMHALPCRYFCPVPFSDPSFFYLFSVVSKRLKDEPLWHICRLLSPIIFEPLTFTSIYPLSLSPICPPTPLTSPSSLLSNQIRLSPSVDESQHIETRGRGEEGDGCRRDDLWDISVSDQTSLMVCQEAMGDKDTGLLSLSWAGYYSQVQTPKRMTVSGFNRQKEQPCVVPVSVLFKATGQSSQLASQIWTRK